MPALDDRARVDAEDIAFPETPLAGDAVHDLLVDAGADHTRERRKDRDAIALEVRGGAVALQDLGRDAVELAGRHAGPHGRAAGGEHLGHDAAGFAHLRRLLRCLQRDHLAALAALRRSRSIVRRAPISSMVPTPETR